MNVSFGIITKNFTTPGTIELFLDNAAKHGHKIHSIIVAYSFECDFKMVERLQGIVKVELIKINQADEMYKALSKQGISYESCDYILKSKELIDFKMVPYGKNRNNVLTRAMLNDTDILLFVDTDVYPHILSRADGERKNVDIDFVGEHLRYLTKEDVAVTTSDYSGYFIIPMMKFEGMKDLFTGIQKEMVYERVQSCDDDSCLIFGKPIKRDIFETNKVLGGNLGINIKELKNLPPFFSDTIEVLGNTYLTRGEDTLLGFSVNREGKKCIDIDMKIFHDTFNNYPFKPDVINDRKIKDRFFYACMGWIGRNPFLNWMNKKPIKEVYQIQKDALIRGEVAIAKYLDDDRFLSLSKALDISYGQLDETIEKYEKTLEAWKEITTKLL